MKTEITDKVRNLREAISHINANFDGMDSYWQNKTEEEFANFCHSQLSGGIGMRIRNYFNLWSDQGSILYIDLKENHGCEDPDAMSALIIKGVYRLRRGVEFISYILPNYEVTESKKPCSIHCKSNTGIQKDHVWDAIFQVIKNYFGERFQEVYHNTCTYHVDFTIYLKP